MTIHIDEKINEMGTNNVRQQMDVMKAVERGCQLIRDYFIQADL